MLADCGPIKRIDLIKTTDAETGTKHSRGFGFVTFALESDAGKAVKTIHRKRYKVYWVRRRKRSARQPRHQNALLPISILATRVCSCALRLTDYCLSLERGGAVEP